jgi:hypothetical protein
MLTTYQKVINGFPLLPLIQTLTQHILPLTVLADKIRDKKLCLRSKGSFGLHWTLIFIPFQSRAYPRNLLTQFQHGGEDNGGEEAF